MSSSARPRAVELSLLSHAELLSYFQRLPAPPVEEMTGEYSARLLDQGPFVVQVLARAIVNAPGRWLCKAFRPVNATEGRGYNSFQGLRGVSRRFRMRTYVGASVLDGKPSYFLDYAPCNRGPMKTMVDEVRRAAPGVYLGIGRIGRVRLVRDRLLPFLLEGPAAPFAE